LALGRGQSLQILRHAPPEEISGISELALACAFLSVYGEVIAGANAEELERNCVPPGSPGYPRKGHTVLQCLHVVLKEEWQHHRYAVRDLQVLEKRTR